MQIVYIQQERDSVGSTLYGYGLLQHYHLLDEIDWFDGLWKTFHSIGYLLFHFLPNYWLKL